MVDSTVVSNFALGGDGVNTADIGKGGGIVFYGLEGYLLLRKGTNVENMTNYLCGSDRVSSSGQPVVDQFRAMAEAGFNAVINLAMPDSENAIPEEGGIVMELGMAYHHIPVSFEAPKTSHLEQFIGFMESLQAEKVFVQNCVSL